MSRSQLVYQVVAPEQEPEQALVITLHGYKAAREDLLPLARSLGPRVRIVAPAALNSVFEARLTTGHFWFRIQELGYPEPGSLGDSLWELEQFIYDLLEDKQGTSWPPILLGYDQGAVMALFLALVIPEYLAGVVAIRAYLPDIQTWPIDVHEMNSLPALLLRDPLDTHFPRALTDTTARQLSDFGALVSQQEIPNANALSPALGTQLQQWLGLHGVRTSAPP